MKTLTTLGILVLATVMGRAQTQIIEYAPGSVALSNSNAMTQSAADIKSALDQLLAKAQSQLDDLDKQLQRTGDYLAANRASVTDANTAIQNNTTTTTKTTAVLVSERAKADGKDVFNDSADGVFKGIGDTYTTTEKQPDGTKKTVTKNRDGSNYTYEAKRLYDISEFYRVRDDAIAKQQALEAARLEAHLSLLNSQDEVETQRLTAQISTIDAELIAVRADVANASHELEIHEKAVVLQQTVDAKAKMESVGHGVGTQAGVDAMTAQVQKAIDDMKAKAGKKTPRGRLP